VKQSEKPAVKTEAQTQTAKDIDSGKTVKNDALKNVYGMTAAASLNAEQIQTPEASTSIEQSAKEIARMIAENVNVKNSADTLKGEFEIQMKLSPKELGELLVKVSYNSSTGNVILNIAAANEAAQAGILSRIADLRESLEIRGMNLENVEVNSGNLEHGGQRGAYNPYNQNFNNRQNNNNRNGGSFGQNLNNSVNPVNLSVSQETARNEMIMNHMRSRRLLYRTI